MKNLSSYCGLVDAKIRASDKDLPVICFQNLLTFIASSWFFVNMSISSAALKWDFFDWLTCKKKTMSFKLCLARQI